ncbi:hypothetical protein [Sphingopyxis sp. DBS4]|uniref:hypothetical protein n=1 Tax=Sphingopyxis sp. DBS4 TaxID=2968500 RepID=UPI00214B179D|nr:hypothetical protein [Sphingopyxis sp. DBS4]
MMEEHFMRGWTHGHERLSADLDRGFRWLRRAACRFVETVAPSHASGEDVYFVAPARHVAGQSAPVRAARHR